MSEHLGEEFIKVRPDATGFRAELQAQVSGALSGVQGQVTAAQRNIGRASAVRPSGLVLPAGVRSVQQATKELGTASQATTQQLQRLSVANTRTQSTSHNLGRSLREAERDAGRYTRGMFAATAASTGFFRAVSFASGAFLIGAAAGATIGAAIKEFSDAVRVQAQTNALIKATGGAANVSANQVDALSRSVLNLTGIDDELIKSSANILLTFRAIRNEVGQGNDIFNRAVKSVADISSVFKTDLRSSAVQVGKALQDPVRGVTALRRSGISLSQGQRDLIKRLVQTGGVLAAQKVILSEVDRQVGKTAQAIGQTLPGRLSILRERSKNALGEYVRRINESNQATELFAATSKALSQVFATIKAVLAGVGPILLAITRGLFAATEAIGGVGTIITAVVAYKSITAAIRAAATAQAFFTKQVLIGTGAITAEQAALLSSANAFRGRTASELAGTTVAVGRQKIAIGAAQAAPVILPAGVRSVEQAEGALARTSSVAAARTALLGSALQSLQGPIGIALGLSAVTAGIIALSRTSDGVKDATESLRPLADAIRNARSASTAVAGRREDVSIARFDQAAAVQGVARAQDALNRSRAAEGSPERIHLINQERTANQRLTETLNALADAQTKLDEELSKQDETRRKRARATVQAQKDLRAAISFALSPPPGSPFGAQLAATSSAGAGGSVRRAALVFANLRSVFNDLTNSGDRLTSTVGGALRSILTTLNAIPTTKQINLVLKLAAQGASTEQILAAIGVLSPGAVAGTGTVDIRLRGAGTEQRGLLPPSGIAGDEARFQVLKAQETLERKRFKTLRDIAAQRRGELATQKEQVAAAIEARDASRDALQNAIQGLADANRTLADSHRSLTDTIRQSNQAVSDAIKQGREAVNQSVRDAKTNLDDLGQAVAEALARFREQGGAATKGLGARLRELRQQILRGRGGFQTERAATEVAFRVAAQKPEIDTSKITRQFADLTDAVNRGQVSLPQFNKRLRNLLQGFSLRDFQRQFGTAATNLLREQIGNLRRQARLNVTGPQRAGGGTQVSLVRPLQAVAAASKDIAAARRQAARDIAGAKRDLGDAIRGVGAAEKAIIRSQKDLRDAERDLSKAQAKETRLNTAATKANTRAHDQLLKFLQAQERLSPKVKPPQGEKGKQTQDLTGKGARKP